ncbi:MAG: lipoyl(octanoyl) transferase LipB [Gammaproteobacteria bacterium]|nr:lipoyl(octanoyl) transferase LipB [Gammaproteobacteria bacterium]
MIAATAPRLVHLGTVDYLETLAAMRAFTNARNAAATDEIWLLQHPPVFTQGQAGRAEHLLDPGAIPVIASDRGGQVTYHGPGQAVAYTLLDLHRLGIGVRGLVSRLEQAMISVVASYGIGACTQPGNPGAYVERAHWPDGSGGLRKIGSLGLRVRHGCSYHGLALNVDMDLIPFARIDPCGHPGLRMTQLRELTPQASLPAVFERLGQALAQAFAPGARLPAATTITTVAAPPVADRR